MTTNTKLQCYLCGNTEGVQEETVRTFAGTAKLVGVCLNLKECSARMVAAVQEKAIGLRLCPRCGADETVWQEVFNEPHQPCTAPKKEELGK